MHLCCNTSVNGGWNRRKKVVEVPKVDINDCENIMENTVLHLKLERGMRGTPLAYVVWHHAKVTHIPHGCSAYVNLNKEMIARASIVDARSNLRLNQDSLDRVYLDHQADALKIDNATLYQFISKVLTDMDTYVYVKKKKTT